ncbi:hypothetical protein QBC47DRAFT_326839 [Echria macrotheca]|uniref:Heterokaryon incompatibility domain-containing protein n=1 Tax=Echria macrotheca TaxID=438768 RepID=A0AAJ0B7A1_9PEZI|nr:hypothetical protein QBC47DRAFT_326839 [Echria macrotheca]
MQSAIMDMAKSRELSPEALAKMFHEIGASPEKLRAVLNLWFVPRFRPTFVPDEDHVSSGHHDVDLFGIPHSTPTQLPYRMFDIETGNLVEFPAIGARGQYCMLSHRWKGMELLLGDIVRAREEDLERTKEAIRAARLASPGTKVLGGGGPRKDDVQLVLEQCKLEIERQEELIEELYLVDGPPNAEFSLAELLDKRLKVKGVENNLDWAKSAEDSTRTKLRVAEMESNIDIFRDLVNKVQSDNSGDNGDDMVGKVRRQLQANEAELAAANEAYSAASDDIEFFKTHNRIRDAIDDMICRLQRWKSAIKLERVIKAADLIFKTKLFQRREKCYLWTDTCCIDKTRADELSSSLSLMGDWYAGAEFCLVQLDTNSSEADAAQDWRLFQTERGRQAEPLSSYLVKESKKVIEHFEDIASSQPEWSTRAWTLQELVMSKTTFYLNPEWKPLSRPAESLGYFYHLVPYINLYTQRNTVEDLDVDMDKLAQLIQNYGDEDVVTRYQEVQRNTEYDHTSPSAGNEIAPKAWQDAARIEKGQRIIALLEILGVRLPKDLSMETARSEIARAVYLAASELASGPSGRGVGILHALRPGAKEVHDRGEIEKEVTLFVNQLLHLLVQETLPVVLEDRAYVARFGQVEQLESWQQGRLRTGFAAQNVLALAGKRRATVATDQAYALMGILGVRFPTFSAEGYPMALARLLDQVIIAHNDVSVFNWSGADMGSPVRGRSLYPSSHVAFGNREDRGRDYSRLLLSQVQSSMDDIMKTYHQVISVLRRAIDTVKDKQQKDLPLGWIEQIIKLVGDSGFHALQQELGSIRKVIAFIIQHCVKKPVPKDDVKEVKEERPKPSSVLSFSSLPSPTLSLPSASLSLPSPSMPSMPSIPSMPSFGMGFGGSKKEEAGDSKKTSKFSAFGKKPSFGIKSAPEPAPEPKPAPEAATPSTSVPTPVQVPEQPPPSSWQPLDEAVTSHLSYISLPPPERESTTARPLPAEILSIDPAALDEQKAAAGPIRTRMAIDHESTISPNPIIVNNSGIEGLFDIQRVVVTMIDHDRLRARIARAVTPRDRISGWCSISTGFSRVIASFVCEKRLLELELDAVEGVEGRVLREQDKEKGETRGAKLVRDMVGGGVKDGVVGEDQEGAADDLDRQTEEERLVSRIIEFIQEPQLQLVAGEWVLARFSGVPGAKWFLCHLELGSAPGQYYGHRIATGEIDFSNSTPEPGLVKAWQTYMERKKRKMCYVLDRYLKSRKKAKEGEEKLNFGLKSVGEATKRIDSLRSPTSKTGVEDDEEAGLLGKNDDSDDEEGSAFDKLLDHGKMAAKAFGEFTVLAAVEKFFEMRAEHLDKTLSTTVLKRTPKSLQTAVENMNDNKSLLPAMFHSSTRVHMF